MTQEQTPSPKNKKRFICIHGHFYQPPRENAWLEVIEEQEGAHPWHDWNARINHECYAPNAAARILDSSGKITKIRNNYNRISFNFGPTLLSWLEDNDPTTYQLIQLADRRSAERFGGHGSAMAQVHSHVILPLANYRDKVTQVIWGIRDFEYRFGRKPEGMWLAETAANTETLEVLAAQGIQFTVLAPRQAKAVRRVGSDTWKPVHTESIDTRQPYWCLLPSGRRIALFFYHGGVSQAVAFERLLNNGKGFADRIAQILDTSPDKPQLAHIATDGESYGHHHRFGEMALADALNYIEDQGVATLTNYGQFLELFPPEWEVAIHENSSWSCVHGVERWRSNCGCNAGHAGWHQQWRGPLRNALDFLRDRLAPLFEREGARLLKDPWVARNEYLEVLLSRHSEAAIRDFLNKHARRPLTDDERTTVLRLMEMQRHTILMYTSCGWFFDEISGIETNQILQYALRAIGYAHDMGLHDLQHEFEQLLAKAPGNVFASGLESFRAKVLPTRVTLERVAMHFAVASLFEAHPEQLNLFNYTSSVSFFEKIEAGTPQLAGARIAIRSRLTGYEKHFCFAVLYLGQQHIIGNISQNMDARTFDQMWERMAAAFRAPNLGEVISLLQQYFGPEKFTLSSLFRDEKISIMRKITANSLSAAETSFREVFKFNYQLMTGVKSEGLHVPDTWKHVSAYVLNEELLTFFQSDEMPDPRRLQRILYDIKTWKIEIADTEAIQHAAGRRIFEEMNRLDNHSSSLQRVKWLNKILKIIQEETNLKPEIWRAQNAFYLLTKGFRKGNWVFVSEKWQTAFEICGDLLSVKLHA